MTTQERLHTVEDWLNTPDDGKRYELIEGVLIEMAPSSPRNAIIAMRIVYFLTDYTIEHPSGYVTGPDAGYQIDAKNAFQPDAGYISKDRLSVLPDKVFPVAPDLAVEVISPSERIGKINEKLRGYFQAGSRLVWLVYPTDKSVEVYTTPDKYTLVDQTGILDGADLLPGFTLKMADLFSVLG